MRPRVFAYLARVRRCLRHQSRWWLRSPGFDSRIAAYVNDDGYVNVFGFGDSGGVRPAFWLNLKS
jgi:hypothetical protein